MAWSQRLPSLFRFQCIDLRGEGLSMREVSSAMWDQAVIAACEYVKRHMQPGETFAFIGHCWGSLLAFEVSHRLKADGMEGPAHLFLSGCSAPHLLRPRAQFVKNCHPVMEYRLPSCREPLHARFSVFAGRQDEVALADQLAEWSRYTTRICDVHVYDGEHDYWRQDSIRWFQLVQTIVEREYMC